MRGRGILGDIKDFIVRNKLISSGLSLVPHPFAQGGSIIAKQLGLGRKRRHVGAKRRRPMHGSGFLDFLGDIGKGLGSGVGGFVGNSLRGLTGGRRRMPMRRRKVIMI
jgi:hypothetical protein